MGKISLKKRILKEMVFLTPKDRMRDALYKEIGDRYDSYEDFEKEFNRAYKKEVSNGGK